ncbi:hypothetical protein F5B19DRAFT_27680 [Rostrohypoxylon terebratum]|nr:hypothetical protein F5B19DRAFT_27680 [Rostrohypoxylon terebratum]
MSMVRILAISVVNYSNLVLMRPNKAKIIPEAIKFFEDQWVLPEFRDVVLMHQRDAIVRRGGQGLEDASEQWEGYREIMHDLPIEDFRHGFHLYLDYTVGHFRMHSFATPERFRQHSTGENDSKTIDTRIVYKEMKCPCWVRRYLH